MSPLLPFGLVGFPSCRWLAARHAVWRGRREARGGRRRRGGQEGRRLQHGEHDGGAQESERDRAKDEGLAEGGVR